MIRVGLHEGLQYVLGVLVLRYLADPPSQICNNQLQFFLCPDEFDELLNNPSAFIVAAKIEESVVLGDHVQDF